MVQPLSCVPGSATPFVCLKACTATFHAQKDGRGPSPTIVDSSMPSGSPLRTSSGVLRSDGCKLGLVYEFLGVLDGGWEPHLILWCLDFKKSAEERDRAGPLFYP